MTTNLLSKKIAILSLILMSLVLIAPAQNVAITDDDTYSANAAAMLDVKSTNKGFLVPRIALMGPDNPISVTKPEGLLIWNTYEGTYSVGYYYWNGTDWSPVGASVDNGLTLSGAKIELGGSLTRNTSIALGSYAMSFNLNSTGDFTLYDNNSSYSCFTFRDNGRVGIGTTAPLHQLHIRGYNGSAVGNDGIYIDIQNRSNVTGSQTGIRFANSSSTTNTFRAGIFFRRTNSPASYDGDLYLANKSGTNVTYSDAAITIKPNGRVGVNTTNPSDELQVNGYMKLKYGYHVNEFSTDGNLSGNSYYAVPTEHAVKYYVDHKAGSGFTGSGTVNYLPYWSSTTGLGNSIIYQKTNKIGIGTTNPTSKLVVFGNNGQTDDDPIFEVKNDAGQTVFAVYPKGVRVFVSDETTSKISGNRGGFAVGNLSGSKEDEVDYLRVTPDSVRIYLREPTSKISGNRGGFAVGNLSGSKSSYDLMHIEKENYFIGHSAGENITTGIYNSFFGYQSGMINTTGSNNVFMGYYAGQNNKTGYENVFIGNNTGKSNESGLYNTFVGNYAGYTNKSGFYNTFIGNNAGYYNYGGYYNIFIGNNAGMQNSSGRFNIFMGNYSGYKNTLGDNNIGIGLRAGYSNAEGDSNIYIGSRTGYYNKNGLNNIFIGPRAGYGVSNTTLGAKNNVFMGIRAGESITTAHNNTLIGYTAGLNISEGYGNVAVGDSAGYNIGTGRQNTFIGSGTGVKNENKFGNTLVGYWAGISNSGTYNTFVGVKTGGGNNTAAAGTGERNAVLGAFALYDLTSGKYNTAIGSSAGSDLSTGSYNTFLGYQAGGGLFYYSGGIWHWEQGNNGNSNVFIGYQAGGGNAFKTVSNRLIINNNRAASKDIPLIYGEFDNKKLQFNAEVKVKKTSGNTDLVIDGNSSTIKEVVFRENGAYKAGFGYSSNNDYVFLYEGGRNSFVSKSGKIGIHEIAPTATLQVDAPTGEYPFRVQYNNASKLFVSSAGNTYVYGNLYYTGTCSHYSDKRIKKNILSISGALDKLIKINGIYFNWNNDAYTNIMKASLSKNKSTEVEDIPELPDTKQIGVIAQDVEKVFPELVITDENGIKSVDYTSLIPVLIQAIKEQQKQIDELKEILKSSGK